MKKKKINWFLWIALFWLVIFAVFISMKEYTMKSGEGVLFKTRPVDPRDMFRGDYVILSYEMNLVPIRETTMEEGDRVYVGFDVEEGYAVNPVAYEDKPISNFIKGRIARRDEYSKDYTVEYGIENYFVPEGEGRKIERLRRGELEVSVVIDKYGNSLIESLIANGTKIVFE